MEHPGAFLSTHKAWTTDTEVTEAVAEYLRAHKTVKPEPRVSMADFINNPEVNEYGVYDWLNLSVRKNWPNAGTGVPDQRRRTVMIGLKADGDPDDPAPRKNSKLFNRIGLDEQDDSKKYDFKHLHKKLSVKATVVVKSFLLNGDAEKPFSLTTVLSKESTSGGLVLYTIRLENTDLKSIHGIIHLVPNQARRLDIGRLPWKGTEGSPKPYYAGFYDPVIHRWDKPYRVFSELLLFHQDVPEKHITKNKPRRGLAIATTRTFSIKPGGSINLPVIFIFLKKIENSKKQTQWLPERKSRQKCIQEKGFPNIIKILEDLKSAILKEIKS
jgi:hypothetical protein